jgi:hypothetical protein
VLARHIIGILGVAHIVGAIVAGIVFPLRHRLRAGDTPEYLFWAVAIPLWLLYGVALIRAWWEMAAERPKLGFLPRCLGVCCTLVVATYMVWLITTAANYDRDASLVMGVLITLLYAASNGIVIFGSRRVS